MSNANETPKRIQRKRTKGWTMPGNTVYVGRPSKWGNPYMIEAKTPQAMGRAVAFYRNYITAKGMDFSELRGKNLACWCKPGEPCHADVLLELANQLES